MGTLIRIALILIISEIAWAVPSALTYQGRIVRSDGSPLEYSNVSFIFQITNPSGSCILYQEQIDNYDMTHSNGIFEATIGEGVRSYPASGTFTILDPFSNAATLSCKGGATYTPVQDAGRLLRVIFHDGNGWKTISPDSAIRSVPYAAHANYSDTAAKLGTNSASDFVIKTGIPNCGGTGALSWNGAALSCVSVSGGGGTGSVTQVSSANSFLTVANETSTPQLTINVGNTSATLTVGNDSRLSDARTPKGPASGDLSDDYPSPTVSKIQGFPVSATAPGTNRFMKYDGSEWVGSSIAVSDVANLSTALAGAVLQTQFPATCTNSQTLTFLSPAGAFSCSDISITGAHLSGDIAGNAAGFTGVLAGDVSGTQGTTSVDKIKGTPIVTTGLTTGKILQYNGASWIPIDLPTGNVGTVTNVSGSGPISVANGGSTPQISMLAASNSNDGYLSQTDWSAFNSKLSAVSNSANLSNAKVWIGDSGSKAQEQSISGEVSMTAGGVATVVGLQGRPVNGTAAASGTFLKYDGTDWAGKAITTSDLPSEVTGGLWAVSGANISRATGNVGIGNAAPAYKLDVTGSAQASRFIAPGASPQVQLGATGAGGRIEFKRPSNGGTSGYVGYGTGDEFEFRNQSGGENSVKLNNGSFVMTASNALDIKAGGTIQSVRVAADGSVGIGTTSPAEKLDVTGNVRVTGQIASGARTIASGATSTLDWNNGNAISTNYNCAADIEMNNMRNGGVYTLVITDPGTTMCNFSTTTLGVDAATVTYRFKPANGVRMASSHTVYTFSRVGFVIYVSWSSGF